MLVDSHAHLNFKAYSDDLSEVIGRCHKADMKVINVGAAYDTSKKAVELANENDNLYASIGLHPIHVYDEDFKVADYQNLIDGAKRKVVAIGETGFDYFHFKDIIDRKPEIAEGSDLSALSSRLKGRSRGEEIKNKQEEVFRSHIRLANKNNLALIIHGRNGKDKPEAYKDIYRVLKDEGAKKGVVHCYGGNIEEAKMFSDLGFHIGFTGIVTFDKTDVLRDIVKWIPLDKMLIETDSPYLSPVPYRGKRNEPIYVRHVAEKIAEIRAKSVEEIIEISASNAINLFNLNN